jgi:hypothetical protein
MHSPNDHRLFRTLKLASLAVSLAALPACKGPDPSNFACTSSAECPGDYHCDLGTATTQGTLKCVSGAPAAKTITVDASKFLLVKQPAADGTLRTTISAAPGAVASTTDFVGVRLLAVAGSEELASSPVQADGSVAVFQLPHADTQVTLRTQDDSGHTVAVTGYPERVVMSFTGKNVPGTQNEIAAYDAATGTSALLDPATWVADLTELPTTSPVTNGVVSPAAYNGLASIDGVVSVTATAPQPTAAGPIGWEQISIAPTAASSVVAGPSPRTDMAVARLGISVPAGSYQFIAYGGLDASGAPADPGTAPTIWAFNPNPNPVGWATVPTTTSTSAPGPFPSNFASFGLASAGQLATISRSGVALAPGGFFNCTTGACNGINYSMSFFVAGGTKADGTRTDNLFAYGSRTIGSNIFLGWWDATAEGTNLGATSPRLLVPNSGMASAVLFGIPVPAGTNQNFYPGALMVGGQGIIPAGQAGANNDTAACQYLTTISGSANPTFQVSSCTTAEWATGAAAGQIGFRTGQALTPSDSESSAVYMFGGARSAGPAGANGLQNDLWKGTISVVCSVGPPATPPCTAVGSSAVTQISWTQIPTAGTAPNSKPSPRTGAVMAFNEFRKLVVYGGTDANGPQTDVWELDLSPATPPVGGFVWRRLSLEPAAGALAPAARTKPIMLGSLSYAVANATLLFGGTVGTTPTNDVWALTRQGTPRLLIKAPSGITSPAQASNASMTISAVGTSQFFLNLLYGWDGTAWQLLGSPAQNGNIFVSPQNALNYVQADGNVYLMLMSRIRSTTTSTPSNTVQLDGLEVALDFQ